MFNRGQLAEDLGVQGGFFFELAKGAKGGGFAGLAFAAGEFPEAGENRVGLALTDEELLAGRIENDGEGDIYGLGCVVYGHAGGLGEAACASYRGFKVR